MGLLGFRRPTSISGRAMDTIQESVRAKYAETAITLRDGGGCCGSGCCGGSDALSGPIGANEYSRAEVADLGLSLGDSLGCGNPTALAQLHPGEIVRDLGSGAGLDVLLSARRVTPGGHAYGGGMTDEILELANRNRAQAGVTHATFLPRSIDHGAARGAAVPRLLPRRPIQPRRDQRRRGRAA